MKYLCTNCGHIIAKLVCSNCDYEIDIVEYEKIRDYARRATYYGYQYRIEYERQVSDNGAVKSRYSFYQPDKWYEWLAMAALSGFVGTYATDLVKYVGMQMLSH